MGIKEGSSAATEREPLKVDPRGRLRGLRGLLIDLDGVLYVDETPLPGAASTIELLRAADYALRFVTNTTTHSRHATLSKLRHLGIPVADEELVTPAALAVRHCIEGGRQHVSLLVNEELNGDFAPLEVDTDRPEAVIVGDLGERFDYAHLNRAFRQVIAGAELVALQKNRYWMRADGLSLDVGPFVAALEYATKREAYVVGKPARGFFDEVLGELSVPRVGVAMIGDDIETDIGGALDAGLGAILVRTGKYREDAVHASGIVPSATIDSIADLPGLLDQRPPTGVSNPGRGA